ncbi:MAG TPA: FtsQ-type POTRA domain-containing protein [Polyangiaceae bacterium]|nr:FtsQ-type POTRA domain-containing protein [Polyangiaceae bacterium]
MKRSEQRSHGSRMHGGHVVAPDEGFAVGESPMPGAVQAKGAHARGSEPEMAGARGILALLWSAAKLASGLAVVVGVSLAVAWSAHHYALTSPRFAIHTVDLVGAKRSTIDQIKTDSGVSVGQNIFALDTESAERKLLENPWIAEVKMTRRLPSTLRIELSEREAAAVVALGERLYLVTPEGVPFKEVSAGDPYDMPLISGASPENLQRDRKREIERIQTGLEVLRQFERIPLSRVYPAEEVHLADAGDVTLTCGKDGVTLELGTGPWRKKLLMAEEVVGELRKKGRTPGIVFLDNSAHPERVVVRMR